MPKTQITLDIGCGENKRGIINIDVDADVKPDIVADSMALPFRDRIFDKVISVNQLEHVWRYPLSPRESILVAIKDVYRVLKVGGEYDVGVPNFGGIGTLLKWIFQKGEGFDWGFFLMGGHHGKFQVHHIAFTPKKLKELLQEAGFSEIRFLRTFVNAGSLNRFLILIPVARHDMIHVRTRKIC